MKKTSVPIYGTKEQTQALLDWLEENREMPGVALPALQKAQEIYGYVPREVQQLLLTY